MGKRTTTRHKEDNTFRFQTFEEKLRQISVNVNLSIRDGRAEDLEGKETYFTQETEKWVDLNRTETFANLLCNVGTDCRTLTQILLQKDRLAKVILEHLENPENVASFEPGFALAIALARDLGEEFYPHFESFVKVIIKIVMESKSTNIIEAGFKCYAYLSKYLRRQIIKDLHQHMKLFSCFLNPKLKAYVMIFACESFSIIAGKFARDYPGRFLKMLFSVFLRKHPEHAVGVATLLFAIFKGVAGTMKLKGPGMHIKDCFTFLYSLESVEEMNTWNVVLSHLAVRLLGHGNNSSCNDLIALVEDIIQENLNEKRDITQLLTVYAAIFEFNNAGKVSDIPRCSKLLQVVSSNSDISTNSEIVVKIVIDLIKSKCSTFDTEVLNLLQPIINNLLQNQSISFELVETLDKSLRGFRAYFRMFLEPLMQAYSRTDNPSYINECGNVFIYCVSEALLEQGGLYQLPNSSEHYFTGISAPMYYFQNQKKIISVLNTSSIKGVAWDCCSLLKEVENAIVNGVSGSQSNYFARLFLVFSRLNSKNCENCLQRCAEILDAFTQSEHSDLLLSVNYLLQTFISQMSPNANFYELIPVATVLDRLCKGAANASHCESFSIWSLKALDTFVYFVKEVGTENYTTALKEFVFNNWLCLVDNLMSGFRMVRALTLSVLRKTVSLFDSATDKVVEMLDKFLELEDMTLNNSKYSSMAKSILTECKVIVGSENYDIDLKLLCVKYTLGLLYTNYNLIWSPCVDVQKQAGKHIEISKFWEVFGSHFCRNHSSSDIKPSEGVRKNIIPDLLDGETKFMDLLTVETFGLPELDAGYAGRQEALDITQYNINLWLSVKGVPLTKKEYGDIKPFVDALISDSSDENEVKASRRQFSKIIIPVLQFLEGCDLVNVNHELWEASLKFLTYTPDVQKAAWKFLLAKRKNKLKNYREDIDEILNSESMDPFHKFRIDAIDVSLSKQYENETSERRTLLMDILIRILIGKERAMKGDKRIQVLRFLAGCSESDAQKYLSLTVGSAEEVQKLPPKIIEIKINKMTSALRVWRYKFPNILDQIVNSACELVCALSSSVKPITRRSLNPEEEVPDDVFEEQKKAALKAGRICIVAFFTSLPRLDMNQDTIDRIFEVFIWPALNDITVTSLGGVSWILKLFMVWSVHERYHILLTKCKDNEACVSPMWRLFDLLDFKSAVFEVKKYLLGIVFNLVDPPEIPEILDDSEEPTESYLNCTNSPLNVTGTYTFDTTESIGVNIVLLRKEVILNLFMDVQIFRKYTNQSGGGKCLSLISLIAGYSSGVEMNEKICSVIVDTLPMCRNNEENIFNSIVAAGKLLSTLDKPEDLLLKIAPNFSWISGRRLRTALVETLDVMKTSNVYQIVSGMNAWTDMAADTPNFSKRQESFEMAEKFVLNQKFDLITYTFIYHNSIYCISKEDDIGIRNSAKNLLIIMASSLSGKTETGDQSTKESIHKFLDSVVLPKLRNRVQEKDDKRCEDVLQVLLAFITSCTELHGTFKELIKLISSEIVDGLCHIQVHLRTRAMNKLGKSVKDAAHTVSPAVVQSYILPIATHYLFDEDRLSKNFNDLIDSSIECLKAAMSVMSHEQYFSYLSKLLEDTKKKTKLAKQFERVLIAIMDAFHFDLSLACPGSSKPMSKTVETSTQMTQNGQSSETAAVSDSEDEDDSRKEEFNIPKESVELTMTLLPQAAALRCLGILKSSIIPKLQKFLHFEETATHKLSRSTKTVDDDVILKIPCTIALVKLLKKIPKAEGQNGIRAIIPSITAGLRNELLSIRNTLRKTLLSVIKELGISHLKTVVGYLKSSLQRGYQKHVLHYTVAYLLRCLENELKAEPSYLPLKEILSCCEDELYSVMQEEKELAAIKQKTREASKSNACPILKVCGKCCSTVEQLNLLVEPAIRHISEKKSLKVSKASRQWLTSVSEGLAENGAANCFELLNWLLEVMKKDGMREEEIAKQNEADDGSQPSKKRKLLETQLDSKLIPQLKKKTVSEGKVGGQSLLMEFSVTCLYNGLNKNGRFRERVGNAEGLSILDRFVPELADGIKASSKQVNVVSLRCITLLLEFELSNLKKPEIIDKLQRNGFISMSNHCYRNTTDSEMTNATFKFLSAFFVRFPDFKVVLHDFELMLKCVQGYLTDGNCSSSALTLLKGVLQNKYRCSALPDLMQEVFKQCITSYYQHINEGCRQVYLTYLNNYLTNPKDLYMEVQLILRQLDYQHEGGRLTATEILNSLLANIPEDCFEEVKELIFLKVLATLDKEKFPKVRERLGESMKSLFKLEKGKTLIQILLKLLVLDKHVPELDTLFLIVGLVIDDPKIFATDDLQIVIGRIKDVLDPTSLENLCSNNPRITVQIKDYMIFQAVVVLKKSLCRHVHNVPLWSSDSPLAEEMGEIFGLLRDKYLFYEHEWVPLITVDILSTVLSKLQLTDEEEKSLFAQQVELGKNMCVLLSNDDSIQKLLNNLWMAMRKSEREDLLAKGAFVLVILISLVARFQNKSMFTEMIDSMRRSVNSEVVKNQRVTTIRSVALGCFRAIAKTCPRDAVEEVVEIMTRVAVRELTDDNVPQDVKNECEKLISVLRDVIGNTAFNVIHAKANDFLHKKRNLNRAKKKESAVIHPGLVRKRPKKVNTPYKGRKKMKK